MNKGIFLAVASVLTGAILFVLCHSVSAQAPACDALPDTGKALSREIFAALYPYDGCDQTFARCLAQKPPKPVVLRLAQDICRHIKEGQSREQIERALAKRAQTALAVGKPSHIALDNATMAGNPRAPVTAVIYACARCPFCKIVVPTLYDAVTAGALKDKVRLFYRPFPLKDHRGSTEGGLAILSAARQGKFWPYLLHLYANFDSFSSSALIEWAVSLGLDKSAFERDYANTETRDALIASKQEGIRNKVNATPTLFIDGIKYVYENDAKTIIDVLAEQYDRRAQ